MADDISRLGIAVDSSGAVKATKDLDRLGDQAATTERQVDRLGKTTRGSMGDMEAGARGAGKGFTTATAPMQDMMKQAGGTQHVLRQMSFQLSQVGQQGAATGNVMQAFLIQLPDMLGLLGGLPLVLAGAAAGLATALLPALIDTSGGAKKLSDDLSDLQDALGAYQAAADMAGMSTDDLRERFGSAGEGLRTTIDLLEQIARTEAQDKIDGINQSISDLMQIRGDGDRRAGIASFFNADIFLAFNDAQREARDRARDLTAEFLNQQEVLSQANGDLDAQIAALDTLLRTAQELADMDGERSESERELLSSLSETLNVMIAQKEAIQSTNEGVESAARMAEDFKDWLDDAWTNAHGVQTAVSGIDFTNANAGAAVLAARLGAAWQAAVAITQATSDLQARNAPGFRFTFGNAGPEPSANPMWDSRIPMSNMPEMPGMFTVAPAAKGRKGKSGGGRGGASEAEREAERLHNERLREAESILRDLETAQERYNRELADLVELHEMGYLSTEQFNRAQEMLAEELNADRFAVLQDGVAGFTDALFAGGDALKEFAINAVMELAKVAAQLMILRALGLPVGDLSIGSTLIGAGLGFRASGGPVSSGRPYIVGERGPELMVPSSSGHVVPNHALGGAQVKTEIHNYSGQPARTESTTLPGGGRLERVIIGDTVAAAMDAPGSKANRSLRKRGARQPMARY